VTPKKTLNGGQATRQRLLQAEATMGITPETKQSGRLRKG